MKIKTIHSDSVSCFKDQFSLITGNGYSPTLAILFISVELDIMAVTSYLLEKGIPVFGGSSCGEFLFDHEDQIISEGGLVCALCDPDPGHFSVQAFKRNDRAYDALGRHIGSWTISRFEQPSLFILASGLRTDGEQLVRGITEKTGTIMPLYGGLAGDDARFNETFVFTGNELLNDGVVALALDNRFFEVRGLATSGWVGIGAEKRITRSEGNIVYTIDHEPALDMYLDYLNVHESQLPQIGVEYPLLLKKNGTSDVLRAVINVDAQKRSLYFAGSVPEGSLVSFSSSPGFEIIESTRRQIREFHPLASETDLLLLFSCMARHMALGPSISEEIAEAWHQWQKPLMGFFTYGEIGGNYMAACDFHNETFTLASIRERHHA